jgi:hypothetical protein
MAIIQYSLNVDGTIPNYISDGGYFQSRVDGTLIGIGSGGGTVLSKAELLARTRTLHASYPISAWTNPEADDIAVLDDDGVTNLVNNWCTSKGVD